MRTFNIILALFAAQEVVCAKSLQQKTKELKEMWGDLKAYPTLYTETGNIRVEDEVDTVNGTEIDDSIAEKFYFLYTDCLKHILIRPYPGRYSTDYLDSMKTEKLAFARFKRGVNRILNDIDKAWMGTPMYRDLTTSWTKAHELIVKSP